MGILGWIWIYRDCLVPLNLQIHGRHQPAESQVDMKKTTARYGGGASQLRHDAATDRGLKGISGAPRAGLPKGTIAPRKLQCFSVACLDMPQLEFGDKIVLPASVLRELQCFKVATPMLFHIRSFGTQHTDNNDASTGFAQYCSVQEFSAPDGQAFIPYWMMQNLHIGEGGDVILTNVVDIPRGIYCRLQPEDASFLDIAAEIGPKLLMESALRRYSVMSVDETILIDYGTQRFYVKVVELKPGAVVSLLGDVDLEMDFAAPLRADVRRPKSGGNPESEPMRTHQDTHHVALPVESMASQAPDACISTPVGFGRRLGDGVCVADQANQPNEVDKASRTRDAKPGTASFQAARLKMIASSSGSPHELKTEMLAKRADTESLAKDVKLSQAAFSSEGRRLGGRSDVISTVVELNPAHDPPDPPVSTPVATPGTEETTPSCPLCLSELSRDNMELHRMRCIKNPSYHKFKCPGCDAKVLEKDRAVHLHCVLLTSDTEMATHVETNHSATHQCPDCGGGGNSYKLTELELHRKTTCPHMLELCTLCGFKIKRKDMAGHTKACSSRTERCEVRIFNCDFVCQKYIKIVDLDDHIVACVSDRDATAMSSTPSALHASNQHEHQSPTATAATLECIYCNKSCFMDRRQLDRHVNQECLVARSFRSPMANQVCTEPASASAHHGVKSLIQGKLKRRADATTLSDSSSRLALTPLVSSHQSISNNQQDATTVSYKRADPLVRPLPGKPQPMRTKAMQKQPPRPTQLESLPVKPAPPRPQDDSPGGLFIGNATQSYNTRTTGANAAPQQARRQAAKDTATRRLQSLRK